VSSAQAFSRTTVRRVNGGPADEEFDDVLAVEEPLEIRLGYREREKLTRRALSITMRTPGDDEALAAGFLFTEGILHRSSDITGIRHCGIGRNLSGSEGARPSNTIRVDLSDTIEMDLKRLERNFYTTSSCGVCGKSSIEALYSGAQKIVDRTEPKFDAGLIHSLPQITREYQTVFSQTGGLHASALFDTAGKLDVICEDVGRHNALDKVIGRKFLAGELPLSDRVLMVSGRASFELVQKALMAGIRILAAVGAPSSLAVELAREFGMTLIGFVRDEKFNIYAGEDRILVRSVAHRQKYERANG
jgi:FdhD protein